VACLCILSCENGYTDDLFYERNEYQRLCMSYSRLYDLEGSALVMDIQHISNA